MTIAECGVKQSAERKGHSVKRRGKQLFTLCAMRYAQRSDCGFSIYNFRHFTSL